MNPRDRINAVLEHHVPDRVPRFEIWIDALFDQLGTSEPAEVYPHLGQDSLMMPTRNPPESRAWRTGVDEWGRIWRNGTYVDGVVDREADLDRYTLPPGDVARFFEPDRISQVRERYPDHCLIYGTHIGPFTAGYMAMGFRRFFQRLVDDPAFVDRLLASRAAWCIAMYREAIRLGAEVVVLGDDAGQRGGPMISPRMWRQYVLPYHRRIVEALRVPVIWHSDGDIASLLPMAVEAGFAGIHGLDPLAGMDLAQVKRDFPDLVLIGNVDVRVLCGADLQAVRDEVDRCITQGAPGGGYLLATCNSIFEGMNPRAVAELFRYEEQVGFY
jgi:uroporphyrinogen decarboxylase